MKNAKAIAIIAILFLLQAGVSILNAQDPLVFKHITVENGLSSGSVLSVTQDKKGFIWAGTMDGLSRFDGRKVKVFRSFYKDNFIGPSINIKKLCVDDKNNVWIGTNNGLYVYNINIDSFKVFYHSSSDNKSLAHNSIQALWVDRNMNIWVGTPAGMNVFKGSGNFDFHCEPVSYGKTGKSLLDVRSIFETSAGVMMAGTADGIISLAKNSPAAGWKVVQHALKGYTVVTIAEDVSKGIWAGTPGDGVFMTGKDFKDVKQFVRQKNSEAGPVSNIIRKILPDKKGQLWIGTLKGLSVLDPVTQRFVSHVHNPADDHTLNFNSIYDLFQDRQGSIWIATYFGGLNVVESITTPFTVYRNEISENALSSDVVSAMIEDDIGNLWIGTEAEGLNYFDRKRKVFKRFKNDETDPGSLSSNLVKALFRDHNGNIWVGMHGGGGINVLNASGKKIKQYHSKIPGMALSSNDVTALLPDGPDRVWVGTELGGVNIINLATNSVEKFDNLYPGRRLASNSINCFFRDSKNNIWIGERQGLSVLQAGGNEIVNYVKNNAPGQLNSDYINCISEDRRQQVWIGTYAGLSYYDRVKKSFGTITNTDGLAGNKVVGIVADLHDNLWVSTNNGLSVLDSARKIIHSFTTEDGLPGNVFNYNSFLEDRTGKLLFGSFKGLVEFNPGEIKTNNAPPHIILTGLSLDGKPVTRSDGNGILSGDISEAASIKLNYDQNPLTIDYAVMNFIKPGKNRSAYMLKGYDKDWVYTQSNSASFTRLPPGTYQLLIRAANNDGIWNPTPHVLTITILPPPWKTWWAYTLYSIGIGLLAFGIIYFFSSRTALRRKLRYEHMMYEKQQELHQMKMDFFTHISHEIRTPLTLIVGPVEMLGQLLIGNQPVQKMLSSIKTNTDRLMKLTSDLLAYRKADEGHTQLTMEIADLVSFTKTVTEKFRDEAMRKNIDFQFEAAVPQITTQFDAHHLEIVFTNLLSNAFKFTPEQGKISVSIDMPVNNLVNIDVCDNGTGIPVENQDRIFTSFYQAANGAKKHMGSGIGLAFSKKLVELHQGILKFRSGKNAETGNMETCFTVTLPTVRPLLKSQVKMAAPL